MLYTKFCMRNQMLFCKKDAISKIRIFLARKVSLIEKKNWHGMFLKIFLVLAKEEMGK